MKKPWAYIRPQKGAGTKGAAIMLVVGAAWAGCSGEVAGTTI